MHQRDRLLLNAAAVAVISAGAALPAAAAPVELWAQFSLAPVGEYANVSISLAPGDLHVGSLGGGLASSATIQQVLSNLTDIRVGGLGNAVALGGGWTQSFGFVLTNPTLVGAGVTEDFEPFRRYPFGFTTFGPGVSGVGWSSSGGAPGGQIDNYSSETTPASLIGFGFSSLFTGDQSAAAGQALTFRWAALHGVFSDPDYVLRDGGRVILYAASVPEPGTFALAMLGLAGVAVTRWRRRAA